MSPRGREGRPRQRAQLCCCHGKGGGTSPQFGATVPAPHFQTPAQKVPDKFIAVVVIGGTIKRVILALVFAQTF